MRQPDDNFGEGGGPGGPGGPGGSGEGPQDDRGHSTHQPIFNLPPAVSWTAGTLIALYVIFLLLPEATQYAVQLDYAFIPARLGGLPPEAGHLIHDGPLWSMLTMVSHAGLHGGTTHLVFNVLWLLAFATPVVRAVGTVRYLILFVLSAMAGAAVYWAVDPGAVVIVIGASGAVSGMMGAALRYLFANEPGKPATRRLAPLTNPRLLMFAGGWLVINLIFGLVGFGAGGENVQIAWQAHVGGFLAGLLLIPLFDHRRG